MAAVHKEAALSGRIMDEILDQLEGLVQFQGLNFRETAIVCRHCGWSGTGGSLEVPHLTQSGKKVIYACPDCMERVAVHNGLTDSEVMQEMEKIRGILAEEMLGTTYQEADTDSDSNKTAIKFSAIRTQINTAVAALDEPDEAEKAVAESREGSAGDDGQQQAPDLDFEAIRARISSSP
jgi:hypothetical protein